VRDRKDPVTVDHESRFIELVLATPTVAAVLERAPRLGVED
jgi:hypothetical protein